MMYTLLRRYFFCHLLVLFIVWVYPTQAFTEQSTKIKLSRNAQSQKSELFLAYHIIELSSPIKTDNQKSDKKVTIDKKRRKENENPILFLDNVSHYIEEEVPYQEKIMVKDFPFRKQSRTILYIFPRIRYMKERMCAFFRWFRQKDKEYSENNEKTDVRREWEIWLGVDIFHSYYKYKEAQDILKEKFSIPLYNIKVHPEYTDRQFKLILKKKF